MPHETAAISAQVLCTPYNHAPCHFTQSHIRKVYACLAVTCHLHFWQNDRDLLCATVVTRGWNGYRNKSQHRKSTLEKKIVPPLQQGFEPATFQSRVRRSNHWAIPAPYNVWFKLIGLQDIILSLNCLTTLWPWKMMKVTNTGIELLQLLVTWPWCLVNRTRSPQDDQNLYKQISYFKSLLIIMHKKNQVKSTVNPHTNMNQNIATQTSDTNFL